MATLKTAARFYQLSPRQIEIAAMIGRGKIRKQIAADLRLSVFTVDKHLQRIKGKTNTANTFEMACLFWHYLPPAMKKEAGNISPRQHLASC